MLIIGFPCNQFGNQEPGDANKIGAFCQKNYGVSFLMMQKIQVNGANTHPIYTWLKQQQSGVLTSAIKWNFTKFLLGRDGRVIKRYAPLVKPKTIEADILKVL